MDPFIAKFQLFQNTERKHFSWGLFLPEVRNSWLQTYNVTEKEQFCKYFSGIFEIFEHSFLSDLFKKSICSGVFSSAVGSRIIPSIALERNSTFFRIFPKVFGVAISKYPHKIICDGF